MLTLIQGGRDGALCPGSLVCHQVESEVGVPVGDDLNGGLFFCLRERKRQEQETEVGTEWRREDTRWESYNRVTLR